MLYSYKKATGFFITGGYAAPIAFKATDAIADLPRVPDFRTEKWDAVNSVIVSKTPQEIDAWDSAIADAGAQAEIDGQKTLKATVLWICQKLGITPATARAEIIAIRKTL